MDGAFNGLRSEPPWEWVDGDPVRSSQFTFATGAVMGMSLTLLAVYFLAYVGWGVPPAWGGFTAGDPFPSILWLVLMTSVIGQAFLGNFLPRRIPVIARLGISPTGLRLRAGPFPFQGVKVGWWALRKIGPDWIDLAAPLFGSQRYKLTEHQSQRLRWFLTPP